MDSVTSNVAELTTALVAAQADVVLVLSDSGTPTLVAGHPMVSVLHVAVVQDATAATGTEDALLPADGLPRLLTLLAKTLDGTYATRTANFADFQIARGPTGVSA